MSRPTRRRSRCQTRHWRGEGLLLQWALIDAPMPKLMRLFVTVIGAILGTFAFTDLIVLRLPFARRIF